MSLDLTTLTINVPKQVIIHGISGNPAFNTASAQFLHDLEIRIREENLLKGKTPVSRDLNGHPFTDYNLGPVEILGLEATPEFCEAKYSVVPATGVPGHVHKPKKYDEFYLITGGRGRLHVSEAECDLIPGRFYYIPGYNVMHSVDVTSSPFGLLVFKFSPCLVDDFKEGYKLRLKEG